MFRSNLSVAIRCAAIAIAMGTSGIALGSGMSPLTGDSYAYFHGLQYVPGSFNSATQPAQAPNGTSVQPASVQSQAASSIMLTRDAANQQVASQSTIQLTIAPSTIFNNNTGA